MRGVEKQPRLNLVEVGGWNGDGEGEGQREGGEGGEGGNPERQIGWVMLW
jgi:hypothetical protein